MARNKIGGIFDDDADEMPITERHPAEIATSVVATAIALEHGSSSPDVAMAAETFLQQQTELSRQQSRLVDLQTRHLEEEHPLRIALLRGQKTARRLRMALQLFVIVAAAFAGTATIVLFYDLLLTQEVVVDPFDAPPSLAESGLNGKVLATNLLDSLEQLQAVVRNTVKARKLSGAWSNDIAIDVTESGISLTSAIRQIKRRFGHDQHIAGTLLTMDNGEVSLTIRGDGIPPHSIQGKRNDLTNMSREAAEYVFGRSQPVIFAYYLLHAFRTEEALNFSKTAFATAKIEDKPYLLNTWANALVQSGGSTREAIALYRRAIALNPKYFIPYNNIMIRSMTLGEEEEAWRVGKELMQAAGGRPGKAEEMHYNNWDGVTWNLVQRRASLLADIQANGGVGSYLTSNVPRLAVIDAFLHDSAAAEFDLNSMLDSNGDPTIKPMTHFVRGLIAAERGDIASALAEMDAYAASVDNPFIQAEYPGLQCWIAPVAEAAGQSSKADAVLKQAGSFVDCARFRADILDHRGDWPGAERAYAAAVALAPDLPAAYYSWGLALLRHGHPDEALEKLKAANQRGPHWADPLKAWGDSLVALGKSKEALVKYDEALKYAPAWKELHQARDAAANKT